MGINWNKDAWALQGLIRKVAASVEQGRALWNILEQSNLIWNGNEVVTGTSRWTAEVIASAVGGDYLDYYLFFGNDEDSCGYTPNDTEAVLKHLAEQGITVRERT